eukprot:TRINITY_DN24361_c0_g1_i1.p1 TRINITY_DN24361_c0_g1~~TRINITY_DN24361_c0_g1_i1.p1  ORF type:complete len:218 (+),score=42.13 TRINITY_DN24361_c0_g1_i1:226-879(+)
MCLARPFPTERIYSAGSSSHRRWAHQANEVRGARARERVRDLAAGRKTLSGAPPKRRWRRRCVTVRLPEEATEEIHYLELHGIERDLYDAMVLTAEKVSLRDICNDVLAGLGWSTVNSILALAAFPNMALGLGSREKWVSREKWARFFGEDAVDELDDIFSVGYDAQECNGAIKRRFRQVLGSTAGLVDIASRAYHVAAIVFFSYHLEQARHQLLRA